MNQNQYAAFLKKLKPIRIVLPELKTNVYMIFQKDSSSSDQKLIDSTVKHLFKGTDADVAQIKRDFKEAFSECSSNPAFTFVSDSVEVFIVFRLSYFYSSSISYFFNIVVHELSHAVTDILQTHNLMQEDDEHRSIIIGNLFEEAYSRIAKQNLAVSK